MALGLVVLGLVSTVAQLTLVRELIATFYGNELIYGLALATWLIGGAIGSWGARHWAPSLATGDRRSKRVFIGGLCIAGGLLPIQLMLLHGIARLLIPVQGAYAGLGTLTMAFACTLLPLCVTTGALFVLGAALMTAEGNTIGRAYMWESLGAAAGGVLFSFVFVSVCHLNPFQIAFFVCATVAGTAWFMIRAPDRSSENIFCARRTRDTFWKKGALSLLIFTLLAAPGYRAGGVLYLLALRWQWPDLLFASDSPYGRLVIEARDSQRMFFQNGSLAFETQSAFAEEVVHFVLLAHPNPRTVLLIGGGIAGDLQEILKHPVKRVIYVELDPLWITAAKSHLPVTEVTVLRDPRVQLAFTDGRRYVQTAQTTFDVVILDLPEPTTGALNRFYTREFFQEVRSILAPNGIFSLGLPSAENYWSPELARRNSSVYHTLRSVFQEVAVLSGEHCFFLASDTPLALKPNGLAERLASRRVVTRWVTPAYITYTLTTDRMEQAQTELNRYPEVRANTDLEPICYYYNLLLWLSRFYPHLHKLFERAASADVRRLLLPLVVVLLLARLRRAYAIPIAIAALGCAQMLLEIVILLLFQVQYGTVYTWVSLIVTVFMGGLTAGSVLGNHITTAIRATERDKERVAKRALLLDELTVLLCVGILLGLLFTSDSLPFLLFPLFALAAGVTTGAAFPIAVMLSTERVEHTAGRLYAADLFGACIGALCGTAIFIPLFGLPQTCMAVAGIVFVAIAAVV